MSNVMDYLKTVIITAVMLFFGVKQVFKTIVCESFGFLFCKKYYLLLMKKRDFNATFQNVFTLNVREETFLLKITRVVLFFSITLYLSNHSV